MTKHAHILFTLLALFAAAQARADLFQYTDKDGTVVIVDDESKIPRQYRNKTRTTRSASTKGMTTAVRISDNRVFVPVTLCYRNRTVEATMLLDTGASTTTISTDVAEHLGIRPENTQQGTSRVADGRFLRTFVTTLDYLSVGPKLKGGVQVSIIPSSGPSLPFDGLLGMNFLGDFSYQLDVNSETIKWQ